MRKITISAFAVLASFLVIFGSCKKDSNSSAPTLYDSLGGTKMVADPTATGTMIEQGRLNLRSVVDSTILVIAGDPQLQPYFATLLDELQMNPAVTTGYTNLQKNLTDFFCVATGSKNFTYGGLSMTAAHNHTGNPRMAMKATNADFDRFVADLVTGATKCGVSNQLIGQVGVLVNSLKTTVVQP